MYENTINPSIFGRRRRSLGLLTTIRMYTNLTVLLSVLLLVNGLDLECSVDTVERLFASSPDDKCELCEILKNKLEITHCQTNLLPSSCFSNHHHIKFNQNYTNHIHQSIHWDKSIVTSTNNEKLSVFHVFIKRSFMYLFLH
jgi:hypothetical protein